MVTVKTWDEISKEFKVGFSGAGWHSEGYEYIIGPHSIEGYRRERYEALGGATGLVFRRWNSVEGEPFYEIDFGENVFEVFYEFELRKDSGKEYKFCEEDFLKLL